MMKTKVIALILGIVLCFSLLVGCAQTPCEKHTDENKDAKCDVCGAAVCLTHADADKNRKCDVCQADVEPNCDLHADADANLVCDKCGYTIEPPCAHKDENSDNVCDLCSKALVVIFQPAAKEEKNRVQMVVATAPEGVTLETYLKTAAEKTPAVSTITKLEAGTLYFNNEYLMTVTLNPAQVEGVIPTPETHKQIYTLKNLATGNTVFTYTAKYGESIFAFSNFGLIYLCTYNASTLNYTVTAYSMDDKHEVAFTKQATVLDIESIIDVDRCTTANGYDYVVYDSKVVVMDSKTKAIIAKDLDIKTLVAAPEFAAKNDKYGYVIDDDETEIYIYDANKVRDCVFSYKAPSYYEDGKFFVLDNGNVLYQARVELEIDAVSYDFVDNGDKYDIVYILIDPAAKTANAIEFGYYIDTIKDPKRYGKLQFNDNAANIATVYEIVDDRIDMSREKTFVVDGTMKILYDANQVFSAKYSKVVALKSGNFLAVSYDGYNETYELIDATGAHKCYINASACDIILNGNCIEYNDELYDLTMTRILEEYEIENVHNSYAILKKETKTLVEGVENITVNYYYYNGVSDPVALNLQTNGTFFANDFGYVVRYTKNVPSEIPGAPEVEKEFFDFYNFDNVCFKTAEYNYDTVGEIADGIYLVTINGEYYIVK